MKLEQPISVILAPAEPREINCFPYFYRGLFLDSVTTSNLSAMTTRYHYGVATLESRYKYD
jgi:hypothetical protein